MTTAAVTVRPLDEIAAEYRDAVAAQDAAGLARIEGENALRVALQAATDRVDALKGELHAAALGMTVDEYMQAWSMGKAPSWR